MLGRAARMRLSDVISASGRQRHVEVHTLELLLALQIRREW
jgi:hypothetical protein